jgi:hypothetical protein
MSTPDVLIPCKRPKVTVDPRTEPATAVGTVIASCRVPGCRWTYPSDLTFYALRSDATDQATMHRARHRDAVPTTTITKPDPDRPYLVECAACDTALQGSTTTTRSDAETVRSYHLTKVHGLAVCS